MNKSWGLVIIILNVKKIKLENGLEKIFTLCHYINIYVCINERVSMSVNVSVNDCLCDLCVSK